MTERIPLSAPSIDDEDVRAVTDTLRSGWLASGPRTAEFEEAFRARLGAGWAAAVDSATAGLHLVLAALEVGPGDEVITPSLTWPATVNVIELLGARPVFADVLPGTLLLDPADAERRITDRTRAVLPVHYAGAPADLSALRRAIAGRPVTLVHDAAHALGTRYGPEEIGSGAEPTVFSFHPVKNMTTAEGGVVTGNDPQLAERIRLLRFHGITKDSWSRHRGSSARYDVLQPGWKYTMSDLHAALGITQLARLDGFNARRAELAARYDQLLAGLPGLLLPQSPPYPHTHARHLYPVQLDPDAVTADRDAVMAELSDRGIGTGLHYPPVHLHDHYRRRYPAARGELPVTEAAGERVLSLPLFPGLTEEQQDRVVAAVTEVLRGHLRPTRPGTQRSTEQRTAEQCSEGATAR